MDGILSILCFTLCYFVAFLLESLNNYTRYSIPRLYSLFVTLTGLILQSLYIGENFLFRNEHLITSLGGWFFVLIAGLVFCYLYRLLFHPNSAFGLIFFPFILVMTLAAIPLVDLNFPEQTTGRWIRAIHGVSLLLATFFMSTGFLTGLVYFLQRSRLKRGNKTWGRIPFPSLEWLEKANRRSARLSILFLGLGILSGFYIGSVVFPNGGVAWRNPIQDPMISGSIILFSLMILFFSIISFTKYCRGGRSIALLSIGCFLFLSAFLFLGMYCNQQHWQALSYPSAPESQIRQEEPR